MTDPAKSGINARPPTPTVSVIVPVHDDADGLQITLESLRQLGTTCFYEVIVCNDGGSDLISSVAARHGCHEVRSGQNLGSYAARNAGIQMAHGEVLAFLDADQRVDPHWLRHGLDILGGSGIAYVGGKVSVDAGQNPSAWERYDAATAFPVEWYLAAMNYAPTANLFVKRAVFDKVGLFNSSLRSGGDREFGQRVAAAGYRQIYCAAATTFHPVRNRQQLVQKRKRTGSGMAMVRLNAWRQPRWLLLGYAAYRLSMLPARWLYHALSRHRYQRDLCERISMASIECYLETVYYRAFAATVLTHSTSKAP
jgi:glycosyltransferase involved in cell wall biosynthesis